MSKAATAMVPFKERFQVAIMGNSNIGALMRQNLDGEEVRPGDILDRVKIPSGGSTFWTLPTIDGDKAVKSLEGVILQTKRRRAYWKSPDPSNSPPDCSSADCLAGVGNPGGECLKCPLNAFGSAVKQGGAAAAGKACKEVRQIFFLLPDRKLPVVVSASPGSLKAIRDYLSKELTMARELPCYACMTRLELVEQKNADGIKYAQIKPTFVEPLDKESVKAISEYAAGLASIFAATELAPEEAGG